MKALRFILLPILFCFLSLTNFAQNVTILPGGITPAMGTSLPRLTHDEIEALTSPQGGDMAYDITFKCLRLYNGTKWVRLMSDMELNVPSMTAWSAGGKGYDSANGITTDTLGNVYITGHYSDTLNLGSTSIVSEGDRDIFVAKYTNEGALQWVKRAGGIGSDFGTSIKIDKNGNICITGRFQGTAAFDSLSITCSGYDIFTAKYDSSGELLWLKQGNASAYGYGLSIALDSYDNVYVTGSFGTTANFGNGTITSSGLHDIFIVKYSSNGVLEWVTNVGSNNNDLGYGIFVDANRYVYITGYISGTANFSSTTLSATGLSDFFLAKYDPFFSDWDWAVKGGGSDYDGGISVAVDNSGNVYASGYFVGNSNFSGTTLTSRGNSDIFVAKYNNSGSLIWIRTSGGTDIDEGRGLTLDTAGNVYVTGFFRAVASFDHLSVVTEGISDTFIAKYATNGTIQWVQRMGSINIEQGTGIAIDKNKNIYVSGYFRDTNLFGSTPLTSVGDGDIYVARIKE